MGAWIETGMEYGGSKSIYVAPHVGAWIETVVYRYLSVGRRVAPHVGAWIETMSSQLNTIAIQSHPMWVRGLKQQLLCY